MIVFTKVRWKNFLATGNVYTEIDLNESPNTLIVGENGAGKSTILDALCFGLFGKPFRKINLSQLVNSINGKGLFVEVEFSIGTNNFKIRRGYKKYGSNPFELYKNSVLINQEAKARDYQKYLEESIIKLNHRSFTQIVILGSSSFVPFMQLNAAARREIIEDILDIKIFSNMNVLLKDKVQNNKDNIQKLKYDVDLESNKHDLIERQIASLQENKQSLIDKQNADIEAATNKINFHDEEIKNAILLSEQLLSTIKDEVEASDRLNNITSLEDKLETRKRTLDKGIKFYHDNDQCPTCDQDITEEFRDQQVSSKQDKIQDIGKAMAKLQLQYEKANNRVSEIYDIQNQIAKYQQSITTEHAQITALKDVIEKTEDYLKEIDGDRRDIAKENKQLLSISKKLAKLEKRKQSLIGESNVLDVASMMLKDKGIKTRIIKQYVPIMNRLINKYLAAMDFFVNFELNEKFEEVIKSRHRDDFSYESFSEGEKMRIDLALLFTWRAIARMKNSTNTNILILDEVFDSSLDSEGTESFLKLIHEVGHSSIVFVISHKGDILTDKFHSVIRFEKHKNFSRIAA